MRVDRRAILEFMMGFITALCAWALGLLLYPLLLELDDYQKYVLIAVLLSAYLFILRRNIKRRKKEKKTKEVM